MLGQGPAAGSGLFQSQALRRVGPADYLIMLQAVEIGLGLAEDARKTGITAFHVQIRPQDEDAVAG